MLSVLRPKYAPILNGAVLATLFIPSVVLLVPLYLTIVRPVIGTSLLNNYLAVWLPAAANAFNILLVKRFFDNLPREVFEAARTDGAGPFRVFWSIVLPMSRPILGVVSVFAIIASLKDYLWPSLVLPDPAVQPLGVRLPGDRLADRARRVPGGARDRDDRARRAVPALPAGVPAQCRAGRRGQGVGAAHPG